MRGLRNDASIECKIQDHEKFWLAFWVIDYLSIVYELYVTICLKAEPQNCGPMKC